MALSGDFKETSFADLLQLYAISRQTVAVRVHGGGGQADPDGIFYFADGDLVGATLNGLEGREAIRSALRIKAGRFSVDMGAKPPTMAAREQLRHVVMEEVVKLDEEHHAGHTGEVPLRKPGGKPAGGPRPPSGARPPGGPPGAGSRSSSAAWPCWWRPPPAPGWPSAGAPPPGPRRRPSRSRPRPRRRCAA
jgi:uncharacterized protein DUF4388